MNLLTSIVVAVLKNESLQGKRALWLNNPNIQSIVPLLYSECSTHVHAIQIKGCAKLLEHVLMRRVENWKGKINGIAEIGEIT